MVWGVEPRWCLTAGAHSLRCIGEGSLIEPQHLELPEAKMCGEGLREYDWNLRWDDCHDAAPRMKIFGLAAGVKARLTGCQPHLQLV